jgi:hypothetical protein
MIFKRIAISLFDAITFRISLVLEPIFDALEYFLARRAVIASLKQKPSLNPLGLKDITRRQIHEPERSDQTERKHI